MQGAHDSGDISKVGPSGLCAAEEVPGGGGEGGDGGDGGAVERHLVDGVGESVARLQSGLGCWASSPARALCGLCRPLIRFGVFG